MFGHDLPNPPSFADAQVQVGEPWVEECTKETLLNPETLSDSQRVDRIFKEIKKREGWTFGHYLRYIFALPGSGATRSYIHSRTISHFLKGTSGNTAQEIVELWYNSRDSAPKPIRASSTPGTTPSRPDASPMAQAQLREWAFKKVEDSIKKEADIISSKEGGLHLSKTQTTWEFIRTFTLRSVAQKLENKCPSIMRLIITLARSRSGPDTTPLADQLAQPLPSGSGKNVRNPAVAMVFATMLLLSMCNLQFSMLRKVMGVWLFGNSASDSIFSALSRIGFTASYTSTLKALKTLSKSAQELVHLKAQSRAFLLIYDNINCMRRAWDPEFGQRDQVLSGTAATFVELNDCNTEVAFNPEPLKARWEKGDRRKLTVDVLYERIDLKKLNTTFALHTLNFLVQEVPGLERHRQFIADQFRSGALSIHRMRDGRSTIVHPLATSDYNEGSTEGNRDVINDLLLNQLNLPKDEIDKVLVIIGGDQSTVEKIRTLKRFLDSCPHGYSRYGWVLPLIQLWHMGWADLERVLATHWGGAEAAGDISSFYFTNSILKQSIKNVKRPDYYPTQGFVFDNLKAEIMDCWRVHLGHNDLETYFKSHSIEYEDLIKHAEQIVHKYLTTDACERALSGSMVDGFTRGTPWSAPHDPNKVRGTAMEVDSNSEGGSGSDCRDSSSDEEAFQGDQILSNTILRMRDSLLHYEFQYAVSEGDIGRAMNVMAVWAFTFAGSGKNKYANELLEITCNFEYEYSLELQTAILNNWLCNMSGINGCWFPMDLLQEHNIRQLKKMSERRNVGFGASFFQDIVSYNIQAFLAVNDSMKDSLRLSKKGGSHRRKKKEAMMKELGMAMRERELHKFHTGRRLHHKAQDDLAAGYLKYDTTPTIHDYVQRTLQDVGNIHDVPGESEGPEGEDVEEDGAYPETSSIPGVVISGVLTHLDDIDDEGSYSDSDVEDPEEED